MITHYRDFINPVCDLCGHMLGSEDSDEPKRTLEVHPCDFTDGECPHGSDIAWWLAQRCADKKEVET